jgi:hypothetical protein
MYYICIFLKSNFKLYVLIPELSELIYNDWITLPEFQLLLQHQDQIAPDSQDPLHELLEDLGDVPTVVELLGIFNIHQILSIFKYKCKCS